MSPTSTERTLTAAASIVDEVQPEASGMPSFRYQATSPAPPATTSRSPSRSRSPVATLQVPFRRVEIS
jgi:hypothetical protein